MTPIGHLLNKLHCIFIRSNMESIIHIISYFGHFTRKSDTTVFYEHFSAIDVESRVLPGEGGAIESQLHLLQERVIGRLYHVLTRLIDLEDGAKGFQNAKLVAFH